MKQILKIGLAVVMCGTFAGCTKDYTTINTDPNRIIKISPGTLLNPILYSMASYNMQRSNDFTFDIMQVALPYPSTAGGVHRYDIAENAGAGIWNTSYRWLTNVNEMYDAVERPEDVNYKAIALTLKAWILSNLTDCFVDIPMTEAAQGDKGVLRPAFNTQEEVYTQLLADLETANSLYDPAKKMVYATEILMANDVTRWKKFNNSLRMRLLLRVSKRAETNAFALLQSMVDDPVKYPVFTSNAEAAVMQLSGITPQLSPWGRAVDFTTFRAVSKFFTDGLNDLKDPRRAKFCSQARNAAGTATIGYKGIPSGYDGNDSQFDYIPSNVNAALVTGPMIVPILPYAEVEFIKSELALVNGNIVASKAAYEKGAKAAIEQWGATFPADYFANPLASFDGTLERLHQQKYFALYFVDYQQWFECRRTGYPVLPKGAGMVNGQIMPVRYFYPIAIRSTNTENYQKAVEKMGGDNINIKGWWEK